MTNKCCVKQWLPHFAFPNPLCRLQAAEAAAASPQWRGRRDVYSHPLIRTLVCALLLLPPQTYKAMVVGAAAAGRPSVHNSRAGAGWMLMAAAYLGLPELVACLLSAGVDPDATASFARDGGRTALHEAAACDGLAGGRGAAECCELLLCAGASPAALDHAGSTPLLLACKAASASFFVVHDPNSSKAKVISMLLAFGSPPLHHLAAGVLFIAVITATPGAVGIARRRLEALRTPAALDAGVALLQARMSTAAMAAAGGCADCPLTRLRMLRSGAVPWQDAWRASADDVLPLADGDASLLPEEERRSRRRYRAPFDRLAWAQALLSCAERAEAAAAHHTIGLLAQLSGATQQQQRQQQRQHQGALAPPAAAAAVLPREREKLLYAAARCVAKWWDIKQLATSEAPRGVRAAEECGWRSRLRRRRKPSRSSSRCCGILATKKTRRRRRWTEQRPAAPRCSGGCGVLWLSRVCCGAQHASASMMLSQMLLRWRGARAGAGAARQAAAPCRPPRGGGHWHSVCADRLGSS